MRACTLTTREHWPEVCVLADSLALWAPAVQLTVVLADGDGPEAWLTRPGGASEIDVRPFSWLVSELDSRHPDFRHGDIAAPPWRVRSPDPRADIDVLRWHLADVLFDEFGELLVIDPATEMLAPLPHVWPERPVVAFPRRHRRSASERTGQAIGPTDGELAAIGGLDDGLVVLRPAAFHHRTWRSGPGWLQLAVLSGVVGLAEPPRSRFAPTAESSFLRTPGFDPERPWMWDPSGNPSVAETPSVVGLLDNRADRLRAAGWPVPPLRRAFYDERAARVAAAALGSGEAVPDPWCSPEAFQVWLAEPVLGINRYLRALRDERDDLREAFAGVDIQPHATAAFLQWARHHAAAESGAPAWLLPTGDDVGKADAIGTASTGSAPVHAGGVLVVGYLGATLGLGAAARDLVRALCTAGEKVSTLNYRHVGAAAFEWTDRYDAPHHDVVVLAVNGPELPRLVRALGDTALAGRRRVGLWFWEGDRLPDAWLPGLALLDEVWVTSEWTATAVRSAGSGVPVQVLALGMEVPPAERNRELLGLPVDVPIALATWDYASTIERKNPLGVIAAWCTAFPEPGDALLVCKTINAARVRSDAERVRVAAAERRDVVFVDEVLPVDEQHALMASVDAFISLHRAEGYGLGALEALARGVPLVCTDATGTQEFTSRDTTWLVPATAWVLDHQAGPYPAGTQWFDPQISVAAGHLRTVLAGGDEVRERSARGVASVRDLVSGERAAALLRERLGHLRA